MTAELTRAQQVAMQLWSSASNMSHTR